MCLLITFGKQKEHLKNAALQALPIDPGFPWRESVSTAFSQRTHTRILPLIEIHSGAQVGEVLPIYE